METTKGGLAFTLEYEFGDWTCFMPEEDLRMILAVYSIQPNAIMNVCKFYSEIKGVIPKPIVTFERRNK